MKDYTLNSYTTVPLIVASDEIWNFEMRLYQDVIIEPGATLTIQCQLEMPYEGRIIVKPNGRLIVDGGKITTARYSNTFWSGIEAWGTTNMNQYPTNHPNFQGLVVLKNGATIENAREGFTNWKPNDWNSIGGVIQVQGSHGQVGGVFLNCRRAAGFVAYQNFSPGNPSILRPNLSYFRFANFVVNDEYRGVDDFFSHVSMWQVDGIEFMACHFENAQSNIAQSSKLGTGINSIDASYKAIGHCTYPLQYGETCPENKLD